MIKQEGYVVSCIPYVKPLTMKEELNGLFLAKHGDWLEDREVREANHNLNNLSLSLKRACCLSISHSLSPTLSLSYSLFPSGPLPPSRAS